MYTPPEDESGTAPLAVTRVQPRAEKPLAAISAAAPESVDGADANGRRVGARPSFIDDEESHLALLRLLAEAGIEPSDLHRH